MGPLLSHCRQRQVNAEYSWWRQGQIAVIILFLFLLLRGLLRRCRWERLAHRHLVRRLRRLQLLDLRHDHILLGLVLLQLPDAIADRVDFRRFRLFHTAATATRGRWLRRRS